ncbi:MAG: antibiotic biosynthesis monooxygenase family protein, partial [Brumimicrobium sp.]
MVRIVKLTLHPSHVKDFINHFETVKESINSFPGCLGMQLLQDKTDENIVFTYSSWESEQDLENYRNSELFKSIWPTVKSWFDAKAEA